MKDYIVSTTKTITSSHFDATMFDFNKFYIVEGYGISHRCLLKKVGPEEASFVTIIDGESSPVVVNPYEITKGEVVIKEVEAADETIPLSKSRYKDLYNNESEIKTGKCYKIKIGEHIYNGFCSYRNNIDITMVLYSDTGTIGAVAYEPTLCGEWTDNIKFIRFNKFPSEPDILHSSITFGVIAKINLYEIEEGSVYFKEMI